MEWTGERWVPGASPCGIEEQHVARYEWAKGFCDGKRVLDFGCGCGEGTVILSETARFAEGWDISAEALRFAERHWGRRADIDCTTNFCFSISDSSGCARSTLPFAVVVAFEVLEHIDEVDSTLADIHAMLRPDGLLLASTPNRTFHDRPQIPTERDGFHVREYNVVEFPQLVAGAGFDIVHVLGQQQENGWAVDHTPIGERAEFVVIQARKRQSSGERSEACPAN